MSDREGGALALHVELPDVFPWIIDLPVKDAHLFRAEFVQTLRESAGCGTYTALEAVIEAWKATAEIYSSPELLAAATAPLHSDND